MRPLTAMLTEAAIGIARGGRLFMGDLIQPDTVQPHPAVLAQEKAVNHFARARQALAQGVEPGAEVAVLHDVGDGFLRGANPDGTASRGAFLSLLEYAWPLHVLYTEDLATEAKRYPLLVVTGGPDLTAEHVALLREYVVAGGNLLLCGPSPSLVGLPGMGELTGLAWDPQGEDWPLAYLELAEPEWAAGWPQPLPAGLPPLLVQGHPAFARPRGAEVLCPLTAPGALYQMGARPPGQRTDWVGVSRHRLGAGQVVVSTVALGRDYGARGNTLARDLLACLAQRALGRPPMVEVEAPAPVELNLARGQDLLRIHLIHHHGSWRPGTPYLPDRVAPLHGVRLTLRTPQPPASLHWQPEGTPLPWRTAPDGRLAVDLPPIGIHGCAEVRW
jgi:hypothetical protein